MVTKSKLRMALAAEKGVDFQKLKEKKKHKAAVKRKQAAQADRGAGESEEEDSAQLEDEESDNEEQYGNGVREHILKHSSFYISGANSSSKVQFGWYR